MYSPKTLFNIISFVALAVVGGVSAQDEGPGYVFNCTTPGQVALTFDDGPAAPTAKLLDYLAVNKTPATFYVLGISVNQPGGKELLQRTFDAGHQIALHSNTHADMNALSAAKIKSEYELNIKAVVDTIGVSPLVARPPFGNCNAACAKVLQGELGLTITQWNCDSNDWRYETTPQDHPKTFTNIADIINPSNPKTDSFITLQHDIKDYSVEYVPKIIELIASKGYTFVTMEQCLGGKVPAYAGGAASAGGAAPAGGSAPKTTTPKTAKASTAKGKGKNADPAPAPASAAGPGYLDAPSSASGSPSSTGSTSANPSGSPSSAGKLASTFSLTLVCLALSLLY